MFVVAVVVAFCDCEDVVVRFSCASTGAVIIVLPPTTTMAATKEIIMNVVMMFLKLFDKKIFVLFKRLVNGNIN